MSIFRLLKLNSQKGLSITEVLLGSAVLAGVALAGAKMFEDQKKAQAKVEAEQKLSLFHQGLVKQLTLTANCNATLKAAGITSGAIPANQTFTGLYQCASNCEDQNAETGDILTTNLNHKAENVEVGNPIVSAGPGNYTDDTKYWEIFSISYNSSTPKTTSGPIVLRVSYRVNPNLSKGINKIINKDITLYTRFFQGSFVECVNSQESSVNNLQNDLCRTLNFSENEDMEAGQIARWNEETQTCVIGAEVDCSAQGKVLDGVDSRGRVRCKDLTTPYDATLMEQSDSTSCPEGTKPTLRFESGKFKVVCETI